MGSDHSDAGESFRREDWSEVQEKQGSEQFKTWQNRREPTQRIEEYVLQLGSQEDCKREQEVYYLRKNHPQLVAALYLCSESANDFCASSYQQRLYLERTPIRLTDIEHIPSPDFLHLYSQALRGFGELAHHFGPFPVEEEYVAVNERNVVKVWLNCDFSNHNSIGKISEEDMVRSIVDIIERNIDQTQLPQQVPSLRTYLYRSRPKLNFPDAISEFNNYVREFANGYVPQKLECIDRVGGIYAIANRDKSLQEAPPLYSPAPQYPPNDLYRPQLVDSGLASQLQSPAPRVQASPINFTPTPLPVFRAPDLNSSVLTPSTVRENVPVARRQAATFYNFTVPAQPEVRFEPTRTAPVFAFGQPAQLPEPVAVKVGQFSNPGAGWSQPTSNVPNGYVPQPNSEGVNLFNMINNEQRPVIRQVEPAFNQQFFQQPLPIVPNAPAPAQVNSTVSVYTNNNSQVAPSIIQKQPETTENYAFNAFRNERNPIISAPADNIHTFLPPEVKPIQQQPIQQSEPAENYAFNAFRNETSPIISMPADNIHTFLPPINSNVEPANAAYNFAKSKPAAYSVDVEDGKSSLDFFKKLNEMTAFKTYEVQDQQPPQSFGNIEAPTYSYTNTGNTASIEPPKYEYHNPFASNVKPSEPNGTSSEEEFGRNAVSNIVSQQASYENGVDRISEPLKFENNMDMKYSIFEESAQPTYAYRSYETAYDPELLADLNRQRQ